jgi:hypothetical protein
MLVATFADRACHVFSVTHSHGRILGFLDRKFPKYHMKILLDFNAKVGKEDILKPTIGNESLHKLSNNHSVTVVNFSIPKNLTVKSSMLPHHNIHIFTGMFPDGKTRNQIDHVLIDSRQQTGLTMF